MSLADLRAGLAALGGDELEVSPAGRLVVTVRLGERQQRVRVREFGDDWLRLESRIGAFEDMADSVLELTRDILLQNRDQEFVVLGRNDDGWYTGRIDIPNDVSLSEVQALVARLARLCDWLEERLVGHDLS
jgi:hypothetical protein